MMPRNHVGEHFPQHDQQQAATVGRKMADNMSRDDARYLHHQVTMGRPDLSAAERHSEMMRHEERRKFMRTVNDIRTPADEAIARDALLRMSDNILMREANHTIRGEPLGGPHHPPSHASSALHRRDEPRNSYNDERIRDMASSGGSGMYHHPHHPEAEDIHHPHPSRHHAAPHHAYPSRGGLEDRAVEGALREELLAREMMIREERGRELRPEDRHFVGDPRIGVGLQQPDYTQVSLCTLSY